MPENSSSCAVAAGVIEIDSRHPGLQELVTGIKGHSRWNLEFGLYASSGALHAKGAVSPAPTFCGAQVSSVSYEILSLLIKRAGTPKKF